jgi:hypothetical protein
MAATKAETKNTKKGSAMKGIRDRVEELASQTTRSALKTLRAEFPDADAEDVIKYEWKRMKNRADDICGDGLPTMEEICADRHYPIPVDEDDLVEFVLLCLNEGIACNVENEPFWREIVEMIDTELAA